MFRARGAASWPHGQLVRHPAHSQDLLARQGVSPAGTSRRRTHCITARLVKLLRQVCVLCRNRLGIRLNGPKPRFARSDGGGGGSHPSNVHDHTYALGTINFTGLLRGR